MNNKKISPRREEYQRKTNRDTNFRNFILIAISLIGLLLLLSVILIRIFANNTIQENLVKQASADEPRITSYKEFMEEGERIHQIRYEEQSNDYVEQKAFEFIAKYEGYSPVPYWDKKQYSCGYGMRCSKNTTGITKEKSKQFVIDRIKHIRNRFELHSYNDDMEVALISFAYNIGTLPKGYDWYIENGYTNALKNQMRRYVYAGGKKLNGLVIRRNAECNLF